MILMRKPEVKGMPHESEIKFFSWVGEVNISSLAGRQSGAEPASKY